MMMDRTRRNKLASTVDLNGQPHAAAVNLLGKEPE
jgi:hypothetical protein